MQHKLLKAFGNNAVADTQQGTATFAKHYASIGDFDAHDPYDGYDDEYTSFVWWNDPAEATGKEYENLPLAESVTTSTAELNGQCVDWARARQPHRKGRGHICNQGPIARRRRRQATHRQMDNIWEQEIAELLPFSLEEYLDAMYARREIVEVWSANGYYNRLLKVNGVDDAFAKAMGWDQYPNLQDQLREDLDDVMMEGEDQRQAYDADLYARNPSDEDACALTHGFNGDPFEEPLLEPEYRFDEFSSRFYYDDGYDFWGDDYYDGFSDYGYPDDDYDLEAEQAADEERYWQELAEMEPTKEEWDAIDDEEGRRQAAEDAAEAVLDHVPMGNAKGTRAQLAVAAARF